MLIVIWWLARNFNKSDCYNVRLVHCCWKLIIYFMFKMMNTMALEILPFVVVAVLVIAAIMNDTTDEATGRRQTLDLCGAFACVLFAAALYNFFIAIIIGTVTLTMVKGRGDKLIYTLKRLVVFFIIIVGLVVAHHYWF